MKDRIAKSVFWIFWSRGGIQVVSFLSTLFVARLLEPRDYGLMAMVGIFTGIFGVVVSIGFGGAIIQFRDLDQRELSSCFWISIGVAGVAYLALYTGAPHLAEWLNTPPLTDVLRVVALALPIAVLSVVPDGLLRKDLSFDRVARGEIVASTISALAMVGIAWWGGGVWALVAAALLQPLTYTVVIFYLAEWWPGLHLRGRRVREFIRFGLATLGSRICYEIYGQADVFIVGKVTGGAGLGAYSMAMQLATFPINKITVVVNQLAFPVIAESQGCVVGLQNILLRSIRLVASVSFPICIGLLLVADPLVKVMLTEKWLSIVPILEVLCIFALIRSVDILLPPVLWARGKATFVFGYTVVLLFVMPMAFWIGASWAGPLGVALIWLTVYPCLMAKMASKAISEIGIGWKRIWIELKGPLVATGFMAATVLTVEWELMALQSDLIRLVIMVLSGGCSYSLALSWFGRKSMDEIQTVLAWLIRRDRPMAANTTGTS